MHVSNQYTGGNVCRKYNFEKEIIGDEVDQIFLFNHYSCPR